ncbi:hypothetical protein ACTMU2_11685 [Cupriavidus basilensis]
MSRPMRHRKTCLAPSCGAARSRAVRGSRRAGQDQHCMKSPFNISSYTAQMIQDQQSSTVADAVIKDLRCDSPACPAAISTTCATSAASRLAKATPGEIAFDGLVAAWRRTTGSTPTMSNAWKSSRPAAMLYGMPPNSGVGGVINIVPKRAHEDLASVTASYASDAQFGGHVDVSRRFGEARDMGRPLQWQLLPGRHGHGQPVAQGRHRRIVADQGKRLRASLDVIGQQEKIDAPGRAFIMGPEPQAIPGAPDGRRNVTQPWEWTRGTDESLLFRTEYDISDQLTVFADAGGGWTQLAPVRHHATDPQCAGRYAEHAHLLQVQGRSRHVRCRPARPL